MFCAVTLVVSNALENLSILTGFPFGNYHHTLGLQVFLVPVLINVGPGGSRRAQRSAATSS